MLALNEVSAEEIERYRLSLSSGDWLKAQKAALLAGRFLDDAVRIRAYAVHLDEILCRSAAGRR